MKKIRKRYLERDKGNTSNVFKRLKITNFFLKFLTLSNKKQKIHTAKFLFIFTISFLLLATISTRYNLTKKIIMRTITNNQKLISKDLKNFLKELSS